MLKQRVWAAAIFAPAVLATVICGGRPLVALLGALVVLSVGEFTRLVGFRAGGPEALATYVVALLAAADGLGLLPGWARPGVLPALALLPAAAAMWGGPPWPPRLAAMGQAAFGGAYCGALLPFLLRLRELPSVGAVAAPLTLLAVWAADTGAYFGGRHLGRRRLAPAISPGKTWEGALAGVGAAAGVGALLPAIMGGGLPRAHAVGVAVVCAVLGPLGDLVESMVKRSVGAKDSSRLIPGHGGVLDRFDALMFAAPGAYAYLVAVA